FPQPSGTLETRRCEDHRPDRVSRWLDGRGAKRVRRIPGQTDRSVRAGRDSGHDRRPARRIAERTSFPWARQQLEAKTDRRPRGAEFVDLEITNGRIWFESAHPPAQPSVHVPTPLLVRIAAAAVLGRFATVPGEIGVGRSRAEPI